MDARGTYPLHVAAEFGQAGAARVLLEYGADVALPDAQNEAISLGWAASSVVPKLFRSCWRQDPNRANAANMDLRRSAAPWAERKEKGNLAPTPRWRTGGGQPR